MAESEVIGRKDLQGKIEEEQQRMKPWEQHSAVISIPRFDYRAPNSMLHQSYSGFLVTCPIKREKSATKEAMSILEKFMGTVDSCNSETLGNFCANVASKRRKISVEEVNEVCIKSAENDGTVLEGSCSSHVKSDALAERSDALSLVKLTRSGLLLFIFPVGTCPNVINIVSNIMHSRESGSLCSPLWCHRIFPIQATCALHEKELSAVVSKLVDQFMNDGGKELDRPLKFAVGYNRRGIEETEMKNAKVTSSDPEQVALLDRNKCFEVVAAAVKGVIPDSIVDLKCPELSVLVEVLPLSGVPTKSPIVAVSVLSRNLVSAKPRLCIRALVSDPNSKAGKKGR